MEILSKEAKQKRAEYMREYRKLHPEKTREINMRYWEKRAKKEGKKNGEAKTDH